MSERILTLNPGGKKGVNIEKSKYDTMKKAILDCLRNNKAISFTELNRSIKKSLDGRFEGKIPWYVVTVKLDLEARGEIERIPGSSPQMLRLQK